MKHFIKRFSILLMALTMVMCTSITAFAITDEEKAEAVKTFISTNVSVEEGSDNGKLTFKVAALKTYVKSSGDPSTDGMVTLSDGNTIVYYDKSNVSAIYTLSQKTAENTQINDKVSQMTGGFKVEADVGAAATMMSGFQPLVALLVGILCYVVVLGMAVFTALDVCYIAFPVFRNKCDDMKTSGNSVMTKKTSNGDSQLRWITDDAQYAVQQCTVDSGKSPWGTYLKKRVLSYIFLAIILFILMTGNIDLIVNIALKFVSGIMDALSSLAS